MKMDPELIAQLVDPADADLSAGSNTPVQWRCQTDPRHIWSAAPNTRRRSRGCPVCMNKIIMAGINDLATLEPKLAGQLENPKTGQTVHPGSHKKVRWVCPADDDHTWSASVVSRTRLSSGCPYCSGRLPVPGKTDLTTTHPELTLSLVNPEQAETVGAGSAKKLQWRCDENPEHVWSAPVRNRSGASGKKSTGCPHCTGHADRSRQRLPSLTELKPSLVDQAVDPDLAGSLSCGSGRIIDWHCTDCSTPHQYQMSVRHKLRGQGCPVHAGTMVQPGINDLATTHPELAAQLVDQSLRMRLSRGSTRSVTWCCEEGHQWQTPVYARIAGNGCPSCSPIGSSYDEQQLLKAVRVLDPTAEHRVQLKQPDGTTVEIDIIAGNLAIEFNGTFWHSEAAGRTRNYHTAKTSAVRNAGLEPITVWEDDWTDITRRSIVIRMIAHRLDRNENLADALEAADIGELFDPNMIQHRGARTLQARRLTGSEAAEFFNQHHIQQRVTLTYSFALCDEHDEPRAVLGLRSPSHSSRSHRNHGQWEIQRYATYGSIPGGFTKLLSYAEKVLIDEDQQLDQWVTLSADESSKGSLYISAGFIAEASTNPVYWYSGGKLRNRRVSKEQFQIKRFRNDSELVYQEGWSEREAAAANGLYRVWDSGKTRWIKDVS